jgi:hypothetical protein
MTESVDVGPAEEYSLMRSVLGIDTTFVSNSRYVIGVAEEAFGPWRFVQAQPTVRVTIRIVVNHGIEENEHAFVRHICPDAERLIVHSSASVGVSDPARREAVAYVTTAFARDRAHFRATMLEALTFALLAQFDRHPLHAAAIARDCRAILLVGESGSGKSTLAYLASSSGFDVLAEDYAWIQLEPAFCVWGGARRLRLGHDATSHFPEVATADITTTIGGKAKLTVELPGTARGLMASSAKVCLLRRGNEKPSLEPVDPSEITHAMTTNVSPGFDRFPERHTRVVGKLAAPGGWRLHLSANPREALPLLETLFEEYVW